MKNYSNHSSELNTPNGVLMEQLSVFITFEIFVVLISLFIVSSSGLVIYRIIKVQAEKSKYDFVFIILSVSNIGVGLFSVPMLGIYWYYERILKNMPYIASIASKFFECFPYSFSCLFAAAIAVDRLILIRLSPKYKNLFTLKILKIIAIILFLISVTMSSIFTIPFYNVQSRKYITFWVSYNLYIFLIIVSTFCTVLVILTHLYILYFSLRRPGLKNLRKTCSKNQNRKKLTNTISWICISQLICVIPFLLFRILLLNRRISVQLCSDVNPWFAILRYSQCFCNALIILKNKKSRKIFKQKDKKRNFNELKVVNENEVVNFERPEGFPED